MHCKQSGFFRSPDIVHIFSLRSAILSEFKDLFCCGDSCPTDKIIFAMVGKICRNLMASGSAALGNYIFSPKFTPIRYQRVAKAANEAGGIALAKYFGRNYFLISDPLVARELHTTHVSSLKRGRTYALLQRIVGDGPLTADGSEWLHHRQQLNPSLTDSAVSAYLPSIVKSYAHNFNQWLQRSSSFPIAISREDVTAVLYSVISKLVFGFSINDDDLRSLCANDFKKNVLLGQIGQVPIALPTWFPFSRNRRLHKLTLGSTEVLQKQLQVYLQRNNHNQPVLCLLNSINAESIAQARCPLHFGKNHLIDLVRNIFYASIMTTSISLEWALRVLSTKPQILDSLRCEIDFFVSDEYSIPTVLPYLRKCKSFILEVLRLYPPAPGVIRTVSREISYTGGTLPRGSTVIASIYGMHTNNLYWEDPFSFRPDRFDLDASPNDAYWPFHTGGHICPGKTLALSELIIALVLIVRRFNVVWQPSLSLEGNLIGPLVSSSGSDSVLLERRI